MYRMLYASSLSKTPTWIACLPHQHEAITAGRNLKNNVKSLQNHRATQNLQ